MYMFICFQLKLVANISKTWTFSLKYDFWLLLNGNVGPLWELHEWFIVLSLMGENWGSHPSPTPCGCEMVSSSQVV